MKTNAPSTFGNGAGQTSKTSLWHRIKILVSTRNDCDQNCNYRAVKSISENLSFSIFGRLAYLARQNRSEQIPQKSLALAIDN